MFFPSRFQNIPIFKNSLQGTSLVVQRWSPHAPITGNMDAIPDQGSKFPYATQCGRRKQEKEKKNGLHFQRSSRFTTKWEWKVQRFPVYPLLPSCTAFPKSSIPTRGHICYDWPPRAHGFTGVHAWAHIPCVWTNSDTRPQLQHHTAELHCPPPPTPPKLWQPPSPYVSVALPFPRRHTGILTQHTANSTQHVGLSRLPSLPWSWAFRFAAGLSWLHSSLLFSMKNIRPKIPYILIPHLGYKF